MPDLIQSLQTRDIGHVRIVAGLWGIDLKAVDLDEALKELDEKLLDPGLVQEVVEALPPDAGAALEALAEAEGKLPWVVFARRFGEIREVGPARRDREQVYLSPVSAAEVLFYRAFLARAFFDTSNGLQEFAYIPEDLLLLVGRPQPPDETRGRPAGEVEKGEAEAQAEPAPGTAPAGEAGGLTPAEAGEPARTAPAAVKAGESPLGRPATPIERAEISLSTDRILDDACTLLAALRLGWPSVSRPENLSVPENILLEFLAAAKLTLDSAPQLEPVRVFLATPRRQALSLLVRAWTESEGFNELRQLPGLACEGEWTNQPLAARKFLLDLLTAIPAGQWWSMNAFVRLVKEKYADFQRPAGDYDSWFIRRTSDGTYLRGFGSWDEVDGALIRYLISGPLFWLGMVDLAYPEKGMAPSAFRLSNQEYRISNTESEKLHVTSQGRVDVPRLLPRAVRYQIARFCEWDEEREDEYRYRITPAALAGARAQGLRVSQLLTLLRKYAAAPVPPPVVRAIQRWEEKGTEARLQTHTVLRVSSPEVLEELRKSRAGRFLEESLGPAAAVVKPGAAGRVMAALAELGLLAEMEPDEKKGQEVTEPVTPDKG
jgi:hypothetical protein